VGESKAKASELEEVDSGWDDDDEDEDIDAGWGDPDAPEEPEADEPEPKGLTPEEREARAVRAAARKERQRAKAAEKAARRKARASSAAAKQKKSAPRAAGARSQRAPARRPARPVDDDEPGELRKLPVPRALAHTEGSSRLPMSRANPRLVAIALVLLLVVGALALFLLKR
jgi:hypothetical protein